MIELYDKELIGWSISKTMNTEDTTLAAFKMARKNRPIQNWTNLLF